MKAAGGAVKSVIGGAVLLVIGLPLVIILLLGSDPCTTSSGAAPAPSAAAQNGIPANYLALYQAAGAKYGIPWTLLAGIGAIETDHGRLKAAGVTSGVNFFGCCAGPMQFSIIGTGGGTWGSYGVDGNGDGKKNVYDPRDAIPAAANYLRASGAPGDIHKAVFAYNHSEAYFQSVEAKARQYAASGTGPASSADTPARPPSSTGTTTNASTTTGTAGTSGTAGTAAAGPVGSCGDGGGLGAGGDGTFTVAPGANLPGRPLTADLVAFVKRMAGFYTGAKKLVLTTGTNHNRLSLSGLVSDHFTGNAGDFGMVLNGGTNDGPVGDAIAASAFAAAGLPSDQAIARGKAGGAQTILTNTLRVQIIWKSDVGGNHHNHVHVGVKRIG